MTINKLCFFTTAGGVSSEGGWCRSLLNLYKEGCDRFCCDRFCCDRFLGYCYADYEDCNANNCSDTCDNYLSANSDMDTNLDNNLQLSAVGKNAGRIGGGGRIATVIGCLIWPCRKVCCSPLVRKCFGPVCGPVGATLAAFLVVCFGVVRVVFLFVQYVGTIIYGVLWNTCGRRVCFIFSF